MKYILPLGTALVLLGAPALGPAGPRDDAAAATGAWVEGYSSLDPARITSVYDSEAAFWGPHRRP
jgi:hypothetical protein